MISDHEYSLKCGCQPCRSETGVQILTAAVKSLDMTDKQILAACRPKPMYYSSMTKWTRRTCLWCRWSTQDSRYDRATNTFVPEPIEQLEAHYMETHHAQALELAA